MARGGPKPIDFKPVKYQLTGGVDSKVHGLVLPPPKLQVCENAHVDRTGSLQRRFGRSALVADVQGGGTMAAPVALATYKGNLLGLTFGDATATSKAYEYSETAAKWISKGDVESPRVRSANIAKSGAEAAAIAGDSSTANGITVHAYEEFEASGANVKASVRITVTDANGVVVKRAYTLFTITTASPTVTFGVRCVARGNLCYVFWYDPTPAAEKLRVAIVDATSSSSLGLMEPTPVTVTINIDTTWPLFDVASNSSFGIFIAWNDTTASRLSFGFVDAAGALGSTSTGVMVSDPTAGGFITCAVAPGNAMHGIVYAVGTAPNDVYALLRSWSGAAWTATATSGALDTAIGSIVSNVGCRFTSATSLRIVYTDGNTSFPTVYQATYTTAGAASSRVATLRQSWLVSKPILAADLNLYFWVMAHSGRDALAARVLFLMRQDGVVVAKALDVTGTLLVYNSPVALPQLEASGTASYSVTVPYLTGAAVAGVSSGVLALRRVTVDFVHSDSHAYVETGEALHMAGGFMQEYDGDSFIEAQILLPFDSLAVGNPTPATTAGTHLTLLGIYAYHFIYAGTDIRGQQILGTNLGVKVCPALTGTDNKHTFTLPTLAHTRMLSPRGDVVIQVYRTLANPTADSEHYLIAQVTNDPTSSTVTFVDTVSDAVAAVSGTFYQDTGELENNAPPAGHIIAEGNGRVMVAGFADLPNVAIPSKLRTPGRGVEFSDFLPRIVLPMGTTITAIAAMNESWLFFTETEIYRVRGEGPNNLGFGEFLTPELISSDTGTAIARSVVVTPQGTLFEGVKGKMRLNQAFQVEYIGAALEKLAAPGTCAGATLVPALQQVRFSYPATTHVFDYYHQQWYVFTHGTEGPTCLWNDKLTALVAGVVYDNPAVWQDDGDDYTMELKLAWLISSASIISDLRVRSIGLVGQSLAAHKLAINLGYDQEAATSFLETSVAAAGPLDPQWRLSQQRCYALEVTIRDAILDEYDADVVEATAGMRLNELAFEVGLVKPRFSRYDITAAGGGTDDGPQSQ